MPDAPGRSAEEQARNAGLDPLSRLAVRRLGWKLLFFVAFAAGQASFGHGFWRHLASLSLASTILAVAVGHFSRESVSARSLNHFDEAVWFMMLGAIAQRLA